MGNMRLNAILILLCKQGVRGANLLSILTEIWNERLGVPWGNGDNKRISSSRPIRKVQNGGIS